MSMTATLLRPAAPAAVFLARHGLSEAPLERLRSDASPRSYCRLTGEGKLLMEDRTDPVGYAAFIRLALHLKSLGLSAPRVYGSDPAAGLALIEDFGVNTYGALLANGHDETPLYNLAIEDGSADAVVMHQVLHFLSDPSRAIDEAARVLAPGGRLMIVDALF